MKFNLILSVNKLSFLSFKTPIVYIFYLNIKTMFLTFAIDIFWKQFLQKHSVAYLLLVHGLNIYCIHNERPSYPWLQITRKQTERFWLVPTIVRRALPFDDFCNIENYRYDTYDCIYDANGRGTNDSQQYMQYAYDYSI